MFTADPRHREADVAIRFGNGKWRDGTSTLLFDEEVFPVCSPAWLLSHGQPGSLADLAGSLLIESDSTFEAWMGWDEWFRAVGFCPPRLRFAFRFSLYTDAIQAARYGQGVALGWGRLVSDLLAAGELVRLPLASLSVNDAYFIFVPYGRTITHTIEGLIGWLRTDVVANDPRRPPKPSEIGRA